MSNQEIVERYLKSKGLNDKAVAGVMGNIQQESNFDTAAVNSSSGAFGLFQWLGGRKNNLYRYAEKNNANVDDIGTQLDFFWHELNTTESRTKKELLSSNYSTAADYATAFEKSFERSGGSALEKRQNYAESYYSQMSGSESGYVNADRQTTKSFNNIGLTWWGDIVKVVLIILIILGGVLMSVLSVKNAG